MVAIAATTPLELAPAAPPRRPRVLLLGTALAAAGSAMALLSLVALYLQERAGLRARGEWLFGGEEGHVLPLSPGNMNLATLGMSLVTVSWVVWALRRHDRPHAYLALGLTLLFGIASVVEIFYLWDQTGVGIEAPGAVLFYAVTAGHVLMTVLGLLYLAVMGLQALGGQLTGRDAEGMSAAALYWYVTCGVYTVVWYAIYITK